MTKEQSLKTFIELFNNGSHQAFKDTRSEATLQGDQVEIKCKNHPNNFYQIEDAALLSKALHLSLYASCEQNELKIIVF